ncbi:MAG: hypothetical protein AAFP77_09015 [Bacteroidota bacterium]
MCNYSYIDAEYQHRVIECDIKKNIVELCDNVFELPYDSDGYCLFHSSNLKWKSQQSLDILFNKLIVTYIKYKIPLKFYGLVVISEKGRTVIEANLNIKSIALFRRCVFKDDLIISDLSVDGGMLSFDSSIFEKSLEIINSKIDVINLFSLKVFNLVFKNVKVTYGQALFNSLICEDNAVFENCHFEFGADFRNSILKGSRSGYYGEIVNVEFVNLSANGELVFQNTYFGGSVRFDGIKVNLSCIQFIGTVFSSSQPVSFFNIHLGEESALQFYGTDYSGKLFNSDVYFEFDDRNILGKIQFENVNMKFIKEEHKQKLLALQKVDKVTVGKGCLKYRVQSNIITIKSDMINENIIYELTNSFVNYFITSNGLNLGVEFVEKKINNIKLFYYTDENIELEEFYNRLKLTEKNYWEFSIPENAAPGQENALNIIDTYVSKLSILSKIKLRQKFGYCTDEDSLKILKAISFDDKLIDRENVKIYIDRLKIINGVNIESQKNYGGKHQFADKIINSKLLPGDP